MNFMSCEVYSFILPIGLHKKSYNEIKNNFCLHWFNLETIALTERRNKPKTIYK